MSKPRRIVSVSVYAVMTALTRGSAAILALLYAFKLTPAELGIYGVMVSITTVLAWLADAGLSQAILRTYYDKHADPEAAREYLSGIVFLARAVTFVILAVLLALSWEFWGVLTADKIPVWPYLPMAAAIAYLERYQTFMDSLCRALEKVNLFAYLRVLQLSSFVFAGLFVFVFKWGVIGALFADICGRAVAAFALTGILTRALRLTFRWLPAHEIWELLRYGLPLVPRQLADWARQMALRLILVHLLPMAEVGVFFLAYSLASTMILLTTALDFAFGPVYFKSRVMGGKGFHERVLKFSRALFATLGPIYILVILAVGDIGLLILPGRYHHGVLPLVPILLAGLFVQVQQPFLFKQLLFHKKTSVTSIITVVPMLINLSLVPFIVGRFGLAGAAWSICITNGVILLAGHFAVTRMEEADHPLFMAGTMCVLVAFAAILTTLAPGHAMVSVAVKLGYFAAITALSVALWIWPNRNFIRQVLMR